MYLHSNITDSIPLQFQKVTLEGYHSTTLFLTLRILMTLSYYELIKSQSCHHIETSQLIDLQSSGFYMTRTLAFNELATTSRQFKSV